MSDTPDSKPDDLVPSGPWVFDEEVVERFDDMLARSIPGLGLLREVTPRLVEIALGRSLGGNPPVRILDIGTSRGGGIEPFVDAGARVVALERSEAMAAVARERFASAERVSVFEADAVSFVERIDDSPFDVVLSILTLQFVAVEKRPEFLANLFRLTRPGGLILLAEKTQPTDPWVERVFREAYEDYKTRRGYTKRQIRAKANSLSGVLVPISGKMTRALLAGAGYRPITSYWSALAFTAFIGRKPENLG